MKYAWEYIEDAKGNPVGVEFRRNGKNIRHEVRFNSQAAYDWASLTRNEFFERYENGNAV